MSANASFIRRKWTDMEMVLTAEALVLDSWLGEIGSVEVR